MNFGFTAVAGITVICYFIGTAVKATPLNNKFIPIICGVVGGILGIVGMYTISHYPANDIITATAVGIVSGLAAPGYNEAVKQLSDSKQVP